MLALLHQDCIRSGKAPAKVMEYSGEAIEALGADERATMTNMAAEIGGFTGIVAPDSKVVDFLAERRGMESADTTKMMAGLFSDPGAEDAQPIQPNPAEV